MIDEKIKQSLINEIQEVLKSHGVVYSSVDISGDTIVIKVPNIHRASISWLKSIHSYPVELREANN